jgi:hypothetical protein
VRLHDHWLSQSNLSNLSNLIQEIGGIVALSPIIGMLVTSPIKQMISCPRDP